MSNQPLTESGALARGMQTDQLADLEGELFLLEPNLIHSPHMPSEVTDARDSTYRRLLGSSDLVAAVLALVATATFTHTEQVYWSMFLAVLVVVPLCKLLGLYDRDAHVLHHTTLDELPRLAVAGVMIAVAAFFARDLAVPGNPGIGAKQLTFLLLSLTVFLATGRVISRFAARVATPPERLLIVGGELDSDRFRRLLGFSSAVKATIVGRVPIGHEIPTTSEDALGRSADLRNVIKNFDIERVVVIPGDRSPDEVSEVVRALKSTGVKMSILPEMFDAIGFAVETDDIGGAQLLGVRDFRMSSSSALIKRATDVAGAAFALLITAPLFVLCALAIKLDSRGPVFFRQTRIGRGGDGFEIFKFRTMYDGADRQRDELLEQNESNGLFKMENDPRITRTGHLLRRTSLDELPQLINVLKGDMSLVGPRPLVPSEDVAITGWYRRRSQITPGITGVWQLLGPVRIPLEEMVKLDYLYVANWSWWQDAKILMRTVHHVVARRGI